MSKQRLPRPKAPSDDESDYDNKMNKYIKDRIKYKNQNKAAK